ncbi:ankyrin repeat domain-containing protein [Streptomyces sp. NPDC087859]|uniref:ankyrin repeat domain-containing protein n=1 Tax=Streptomyces sp. NPDC087859 TaxID=3365812 RepID=UPI00380AD50E
MEKADPARAFELHAFRQGRGRQGFPGRVEGGSVKPRNRIPNLRPRRHHRPGSSSVSDTVRATTGTDDDLFHAVSPAHGARPPEQVARVRALLAEGAEVSAPDEQGATPLHRAVQAPYQDRDPLPSLEVVRALLESGADVHARDRIGVTPAARAVLLNDTSTQAAVDRSVAVLELLVEHGARLDGPCGDVMGGSFAHHSTTATPVYAFLLDHGAPTTDPAGRRTAPGPVQRPSATCPVADRAHAGSGGGARARALPPYRGRTTAHRHGRRAPGRSGTARRRRGRPQAATARGRDIRQLPALHRRTEPQLRPRRFRVGTGAVPQSPRRHGHSPDPGGRAGRARSSSSAET